MSTPLTDSINALTTYANEVTGASDTNLSDAVHTLASGYGGGYTLDDIAEGALTNMQEVTITSNNIAPYTFSSSRFKVVHLANATFVGFRAFAGSYVQIVDISKVENVTDAFYGCSYLTGSYGESDGVLRLPKLKKANRYAFYNTQIKKVFFESIAEDLQKEIFYSCNKLTDIYVPWSEGEVANAPWTNNANTVVHYDTVYDENGEPIE